MIVKTKHKMLLASITQKPIVKLFDLLGSDSRNMICSRHGVKYLLDLREGIDFALFMDFFEKSTLKTLTRLVHPGMTVLDIGANIGAHALQLARLVGPRGRVIAFEPTRYAYTKLLKNLELNPELRERLVAEQIMLVSSGDTVPVDSLYSSWPLTSTEGKHPFHCGQKKGLDGSKAISLDTYISKQRMHSVNIVKMDVDGFECDILRGASQVIREFQPVFIMELCPYALDENGASLEEILDLLKTECYILKVIGWGNSFTDAIIQGKKIPIGASVNIVAKPDGVVKSPKP
jgi:FkbM family methyltransferase